ncbi:MAG TPA: glycosyltransferase [Ignavibacteria bacterium]|nr:glycosyltransferase [Ignavibacteria bacterium]HMR40217.1 glycosyltransferase [Ignavibacteria bacterium]
MSGNNIDVSVVIVNYNVRDLLDSCIASVYKANNDRYNIEIFLVDNNSVDGSVSHISNKYPPVKIISNESNIGFSKANNLALRQAAGDYVLILNPDTVLEEGTFEKMISFCQKDSSIGAVTSKLILANGKLDSACRRSFPVPSVAIPRMLGLSKLFPDSKLFGKYNLTYLDENNTYEVEAICGAFMFIPKPVLEKSGLFDEDYFMYGEDLDLCFKIKKAGFKIFYYPEVTTIHFKGESTKKTNLSYVNNFYGAMSIFVRKNLKGSSKFLSLILQIGIFWRSLFSYIKRFFKNFIFPIIDVIFLYLSLIISVKFRFGIFPNKDYMFIISVYVFVWLALLAMFGLYTRKNFLSIRKTFTALISGFFINSSITYFFKEYAFSRGVILSSTVLALFFLILVRGSYSAYIFIVSKNILLNKINLLIVGKQVLNQNVEDKLIAKYNIFHFDDIATRKSITELEEIILINKINEVVFTGDHFSNQDILNLMWDFRSRNVRFKILPTGKELILSRLNMHSFDEINLVEIEYNINNKLNIFLKRIFDIFFSLFLLITVYPFLFLYTKISGKSLSKHFSKLLLLPKVLKGEYSFVGYPVWIEQEQQFIGKKGLTGLIQLNFNENISAGEIENLHLYYAKNQSVMLDLEILLKSFFSFFKK